MCTCVHCKNKRRHKLVHFSIIGGIHVKDFQNHTKSSIHFPKTTVLALKTVCKVNNGKKWPETIGTVAKG